MPAKLDLPPGTGDVAISVVSQLIPNAELLVVTTPQLAAAEVAERAGKSRCKPNECRRRGEHVLGAHAAGRQPRWCSARRWPVPSGCRARSAPTAAAGSDPDPALVVAGDSGVPLC